MSEEGAYCAFCITFQDQSDAKQNTEFVQVPFHDWKNTMGDKRCPLKIHAQSERHLMVLEVRDNFVPSVTQSLSKAYHIIDPCISEKGNKKGSAL